jgi:hypothetical protein
MIPTPTKPIVFMLVFLVFLLAEVAAGPGVQVAAAVI